jgi:hypothetical protein
VKSMGSGISQPVVAGFCAPGEVVVRRGTRVRATDGPVGQVDAFLIDPTTRRITQLVLRESHLWSRRDVMVPLFRDRVCWRRSCLPETRQERRCVAPDDPGTTVA